MSQYEEQSDSIDSICPYCGDRYQVEAEEYNEEAYEVECDGCGKKYWLHQNIEITHHTRPDCELNSKEHKYELVTLKNGRRAYFCSVCDRCKPYTAAEG